MFEKAVWDGLSFAIWCGILLEAAISRWEQGIDVVSDNTQVGCGDTPHTITPQPAAFSIQKAAGRI